VNEEEFLQAVTTEPENFDVQTIFYFDMIPSLRDGRIK